MTTPPPRYHGPNPYPHDSTPGAFWELNRALRTFGYVFVQSLKKLKP